MSDLDQERFDWEKKEKTADQEFERTKFTYEKEHAKWDGTFLVKAGLPIGLAAIALAQVFLGIATQAQTAEHNKAELRRAQEHDQEEGNRARSKEALEFTTFVYERRADFFSPNPETKCRAVDIASLMPAFKTSVGILRIDADLCSTPDRAAAIKKYRLEPCSQGAPAGYVRMDPAKGQLFSQVFPVTTQNRHGNPTPASDTYEISQPGAELYRVDYSCSGSGNRCGYSYNPHSEKGYQGEIKILENKRAFSWQRNWDGDPVTEYYTAYFQVPIASIGAVPETACR